MLEQAFMTRVRVEEVREADDDGLRDDDTVKESLLFMVFSKRHDCLTSLSLRHSLASSTKGP
jgi:hypothetical protein